MASQWFYQILGEELGPSSFQDLAALARAGTLTRDDLVRRAQSREWIRAGDVIGLFRDDAAAAQSAPAKSPSPAKPLPPAPSPPEPAPIPQSGRRSWKRVVAGVGLAGIAVAAMITVAWWNRTPRFPEPKLPAARAKSVDPAVVLPPQPPAASIPGLAKLEATLVPGLEEIAPAFSPCLSGDLRTILFSGPGNPGTRYDLYSARRDDPSGPFGQPELVRSTVSPDLDTRPSLSPDGLRLIFVCSDKNPQLLYASRPSATAEFGEPVPLQLDGLATEGLHTGFAQFVNTDEITVRIIDLDTEDRFLYLLRGTAQGTAFGSPQELPMAHKWVTDFLAPNKLRTYFAMPEGICISGRADVSHPFSPSVKLLDVSVTGPIDGPIWVAPQEDVIVYCSPGPGQKPGSARRLWMVAF